MATNLTNRVRAIGSGLSLPDWVALALLVSSGVLLVLREFFEQIPIFGFLLFLGVCAAAYWLVRGWNWARDHLLWSLRNRLVAAYVFIAVVPVLLMLVMAGLAAYLLYWQLGSYVIHNDLEASEQRASVFATTLATSYAVEAASGRSAAALTLPVDPQTYLRNAMMELPGLKIETGVGEELLAARGVFGGNRFRGLVFSQGQLALRAVVARPTPTGRLVVSATVPVTPEFVDTLAPELGPISFSVLSPMGNNVQSEVPIVINSQRFAAVEKIGSAHRSIPKAVNPFDKLITGIVGMDVVNLDQKPGEKSSVWVFATFSTRPSVLNRRLFSPLGDLGTAAAAALLVIGAVFFLIEIGSLVTGIVMTRTITTAVDSLYQATQHVQAGDFTYRVRLPHRDQLAALGESFNSMTQSVSTLIEEQLRRQRLENELSIAREVQEQLFPRSLPCLPGIEMQAIWRPARVVSGDYYDFIPISPTRLAIALADISGKGMSAALLMANVQAALRSDVLRYRDAEAGAPAATLDTAEIVSHLNRHLFHNTSDERYATFFLGIYDTETRTLHYTNAGHFPPLYICDGNVRRLETGGTVVGLFSETPFERGAIEIDCGGFLVAYSDGLIEPTNVYGEEFGSERLLELAVRNREATPHVLAETLMHAAEEWSGEHEQADDMTVIVIRFAASPREKRA